MSLQRLYHNGQADMNHFIFFQSSTKKPEHLHKDNAKGKAKLKPTSSIKLQPTPGIEHVTMLCL